jgi:signal transduction histidine kinase/ActR/RegA family two-component response regulator
LTALLHVPQAPQGGDGAELERAVRAITETFEAASLGEGIARSALPLVGARSSGVWLAQPGGSLARVATAAREYAGPEGEEAPARGLEIAARAAAERRMVWAPDAGEADRARPAGMPGDDLPGPGGRAALAVPLIASGHAAGVLVLEWDRAPVLSPVEIDRVQAFADRIAPVVRHLQRLARPVAPAGIDEDTLEFLGVLAHEFRNSLAPIVTSAALIHRVGLPGIVQDSATVVKRQARHLARLLDDLLDISRLALGRFELRREPVSLAAIVDQEVEATRSTAELAGVTLALALPPAPAWVAADPSRLKQVVLNLLGNAVKYTPAGGRIDVTVEVEAGEAVLQVRDTGIGIDPGMLPRVFDLYARGTGSRARAPDGLGIGLTLVRQLVELHGGRVSARSDGLDRGSTFTVRLPLAAAPERPGPAAGGAATAGSPHVVLLVEDDSDTRETLCALLAHEGHRVEVADDGPSGLALEETTRPEVVLIDLSLPTLSGYEVAVRIRARRGDSPLLVAITGDARPDARRRSAESGFDAHLTKPVLSHDLLRVIAALDTRALVQTAPRGAV